MLTKTCTSIWWRLLYRTLPKTFKVIWRPVVDTNSKQALGVFDGSPGEIHEVHYSRGDLSDGARGWLQQWGCLMLDWNNFSLEAVVFLSSDCTAGQSDQRSASQLLHQLDESFGPLGWRTLIKILTVSTVRLVVLLQILSFSVPELISHYASLWAWMNFFFNYLFSLKFS